jgi:peroxiredoxin
MRLILLALLCLSLNCAAQVIQNFSLTDVRDGKVISLEDFAASHGVVIIFTSINCPYDGYYQTRIKELSEKYNTKIPILLINSSVEESVDQMKRYASQNSLPAPYLADKEQKVLANLHPRKSPECFLLQSKDSKFTIVYRGAIDDNPQTSSQVKSFLSKRGH